ncbi:hypothetical protein [Marinithermus hydrothermalis]|uniref:Uncharacterized protein n=1 Tax=Marinithermus hydrothermalis (strain DSM 14884 / JCM 11576 / T1) TaxID=869210 RepID=F2NKE5_MARHT|nr:hypothetical protein [Marinithermus hydrothermalis]AEB12394.1 hypothetical protein Marky_1659 [Marinithermus hydrothermalis DSM 14884]
MSKGTVFWLMGLVSLLLGVVAAPPVGARVETPTRLLKAYWYTKILGGALHRETQGMVYRPGQFDAGLVLDPEDGLTVEDPGPYRGVDVLLTVNWGTGTTYTRPDYHRIVLNREARVGVIWYGTPEERPEWLSGWERGQDIVVNGTPVPTFWTQLPAGPHDLGSVESKAPRIYTILLAEADGSPSPVPPAPVGLEPPKPNATCPSWVHDQYTVQGPDGRVYRTWHPQIDPVYWCYFRHEHGSDPSRFAGYPQVQPLFNYTSPAESHAGFKVLVTEKDGVSLMITWHADTSSAQRVCLRYHTLDIALADAATGEVLAHTHQEADFGIAYIVKPGTAALQPLRPRNCPENAALDPGTVPGRRNLTPATAGAGHEAWQAVPGPALPLLGSLVLVVDNPITRCADPATCDTLIPGGPNDGTRRWFTISGSTQGLILDGTRVLEARFCTDPRGQVLRDCNAPDAVTQYVKPGVRVEIATPRNAQGVTPKFWVEDPWSAFYEFHEANEPMLRMNQNLELQIRPGTDAN